MELSFAVDDVAVDVVVVVVVVEEPLSERVSSEDSMPESRLIAEGGGMG